MSDTEYAREVTCKKQTETGWEEQSFLLTRECAFTVTVNGKTEIGFVCSPPSPEELIVGRLITSGIIGDRGDILSLDTERFCVTTKKKTKENRPRGSVDGENLKKAYLSLRRSAHGTHNCALTDGDGAVLFYREDVGRHNAIDRTVGAAALADKDVSGCALLFSGRVSEEAVRKTAAAGIPALCSKAMPTDRAVAAAHDLGVALYCLSPKDGFLRF